MSASPVPPQPAGNGGPPRSAAAATALREFLQAVEAPTASGVALGNWRWTVRQRMAAVREVLVREYDVAEDGWLNARRAAMLRERTALLMRMSDLGPRILEEHDVSHVRADLLRLLGDVSHHLQRLRDLAYDEVEMELGGSE